MEINSWLNITTTTIKENTNFYYNFLLINKNFTELDLLLLEKNHNLNENIHSI